MGTTTTAVEKRQAEQKGLLTLLEETKPQLGRLLPDPDRLARVLITEARRTPKLLECTPDSFLGAALQTAQLGLEPGPHEHVYLIPRKSRKDGNRLQCQLLVGYRGYIELAERTGRFRITAATVHEADDFDYRLGVDPDLTHRPALGERGEVVAAYAIAHDTAGGIPIIAVLTLDEILERKAASEAGRNDQGPWRTHFPQMARKSAIRALWPQLPTSSPEMQRAFSVDEQTVTPTTVTPLGDGQVDTDTGEIVVVENVTQEKDETTFTDDEEGEQGEGTLQEPTDADDVPTRPQAEGPGEVTASHRDATVADRAKELGVTAVDLMRACHDRAAELDVTPPGRPAEIVVGACPEELVEAMHAWLDGQQEATADG